MSRWSIRRDDQVIGHLARHPDASAEEIAERHKRDPKHVLATLRRLEELREVTSELEETPGVTGIPFGILTWRIADGECDLLRRRNAYLEQETRRLRAAIAVRDQLLQGHAELHLQPRRFVLDGRPRAENAETPAVAETATPAPATEQAGPTADADPTRSQQ